MSHEEMDVDVDGDVAPRRWGWRSLVGAWAAYWAGLASVTLGPFGLYVWRLARSPGGRGNISLSLGDNAIQLTALRDGITAWSGSVSPGVFALWVAGPPLAIWVLWLLLRPPRHGAEALSEPTGAGALRDGTPEAWPVREAGESVRSATTPRERAR